MIAGRRYKNVARPASESRCEGTPSLAGPPENLAVAIVRALRPRQWVKNVLVVAAPLATLGGHVQYNYYGPRPN